METVDLSIVIVSYQVAELLEHCLDSLMQLTAPPRIEVIVVDNGSTDGSADMVRSKFPEARLILNSENVGFSKANNQGLRIARGRYWMLLNPDTEIAAGTENPFQVMLAFMDAHPHAAACGPSLFYPDGKRQHSAFYFPTLAQIYMDLFSVHWRLRESRWNGRYPLAVYERGEPFPIDHPLGAALVVRPEAARAVGLLDEEYFIYAEEVDWCMRMKRAGWEIWCVPRARIIHHEARSTRQFRDKMFVELWKARFLLFRKNYSGMFNWAARALVRQGMERAMHRLKDGAQGQVTQEEMAKRMAAYKSVAEMASR